jgi:hypothetical protein
LKADDVNEEVEGSTLSSAAMPLNQSRDEDLSLLSDTENVLERCRRLLCASILKYTRQALRPNLPLENCSVDRLGKELKLAQARMLSSARGSRNWTARLRTAQLLKI